MDMKPCKCGETPLASQSNEYWIILCMECNNISIDTDEDNAVELWNDEHGREG